MNNHTRNATKKPGFWNNSSDLSVDKENAGSMSSIKKLSHKTTGKWKLTSINQWCQHKHNKVIGFVMIKKYVYDFNGARIMWHFAHCGIQ